MKTGPERAWLLWGAFPAVSVLAGKETLAAWAKLAWADERYTYLLMMPPLAAVLVWMSRGHLPPDRGSRLPGILLLVGGMAGLAGLRFWPEHGLTAGMIPVVCVWVGSAAASFGSGVFRRFRAAVAALLLTVPLPAPVLHGAEVGLQHASAEVASILFRFLDVPVYREGMIFQLPGIRVEVAEECSGIRSTTGLVLAAGLSAYLFLRSTWSRAAFLLLAVPVGILKNALRIATLSWLAVYVSPEYLSGPLHRYGGPPFTVVAIGLLVPCLLLMQRFEGREPRP